MAAPPKTKRGAVYEDLWRVPDTMVAENSFSTGNPNCNGNSYSERLDTPAAQSFINSFS